MKFSFQQKKRSKIVFLDAKVSGKGKNLIKNLLLVAPKDILTVFYHPHINLV